MQYAIDRFEQQVRAALFATGEVPDEQLALETPKAGIEADLTFPAFRTARERGIAPPELARRIAERAQPDDVSLVGAVTAAGPYVNAAVAPARFAAAVLREVHARDARYGHDDLGAGRTVVVDYSSPNAAKRMHVGNIRSTIIGQAIVNILAALGYYVVRDNHLGDWGKSFGVLLAAIDHAGFPAAEGEALLAALEELYARYSSLAAADPAIDDEARRWSLRLEQGDARAREIWQRAIDLTLAANQTSYDRLGVRFDHVYGESFYEPLLAGVIADALAREVARRDASGAVVVDLADLPTFLLQRGDGGTLYHTRDVATVKFRVATFQPDQIVYVIGQPQELYLRQLFALGRALGYAGDTALVHVSFGTVFDASGQALSTRRGNMVYLATLLDEAHERARRVVDAADPDLPAEERERIAEAVGVGAVIYNDLHQDPRRNITLDWDRMLALEGDSAPYIQYMHARCRSILRRAQDDGLLPDGAIGDAESALLAHPSELALVKQLARLPLATREAGREYAPRVVAGWCYATARALAAFYRDCHVLGAEPPALRAARLHLVSATARCLANGLRLLGIAAPERL
jgi:arginyl-tRNA synthetase